LNVALYGKGGKRWTMTERGGRAVARGADWLTIGPSSLTWDGAGLTVRIDEIALPLPRRIRGTVRLYPSAVEHRVLALDAGGLHRWRPITPCARVEVVLRSPGLSWSGPAYLDTNSGDRSMEADFTRWDWSRAPVPGGTVVLYNIMRRNTEGPLPLAMRYDAAGGVHDFDPPSSKPLPHTRWGVARCIGSDADAAPMVVATLEDTPFYARSIVASRLLGRRVTAMHESLSLTRFSTLWVQALLPFRMPRAIRGTRTG
jgi:carotenoid 1,2-hydratase